MSEIHTELIQNIHKTQVTQNNEFRRINEELIRVYMKLEYLEQKVLEEQDNVRGGSASLISQIQQIRREILGEIDVINSAIDALHDWRSRMEGKLSILSWAMGALAIPLIFTLYEMYLIDITK